MFTFHAICVFANTRRFNLLGAMALQHYSAEKGVSKSSKHPLLIFKFPNEPQKAYKYLFKRENVENLARGEMCYSERSTTNCAS